MCHSAIDTGGSNFLFRCQLYAIACLASICQAGGTDTFTIWLYAQSSFRAYVTVKGREDFFFICIVGGGIKAHSTLRPLNGLSYQPRMIMIMEKWVEWLAGETEVLGENLPQCRFVHHKPHILPVSEPEPPRWEANV
jgi:hypothetical protein